VIVHDPSWGRPPPRFDPSAILSPGNDPQSDLDHFAKLAQSIMGESLWEWLDRSHSEEPDPRGLFVTSRGIRGVQGMTAVVPHELAAIAAATAPATVESAWVIRHRIVLAVILVLAIALAEPAYAHLLPPEVHELLAKDQGSLTFPVLLASSLGTLAAVNSKKK